MKGVAFGINPDAQLIDLTHEIPPQKILQAALIWNDAINAFPAETIHVGVVDPGVGSSRRLVAAVINGRRFVCPDNGLLSAILQTGPLEQAVSLDETRWWRPSVSSTFHGRDIMAPVAAAWSLGHELTEFGSALQEPLITVALPRLVRGKASIIGQVVHVDRFGNLITNIRSDQLPADLDQTLVEVGAYRIDGIATRYSDVEPDEIVALVSSGQFLEIAVRDGNAFDELQAGFGHPIVVRWSGTLS